MTPAPSAPLEATDADRAAVPSARCSTAIGTFVDT
jgi:hypothetical protein